MAGQLAVGLTAHVDAGKTTLSEAMLFLSGALRKQGRVDHRDAFLDTEEMEKERGITIFSKEARLEWKKTKITLVDTPGHTDFSGEAERVMGILDLAVLVVSAPEGIQQHTRTLWKLLESYGVPTVLFINKMDRYGGTEETVEQAMQAFDGRIVPFTGNEQEKIALCDETCLDLFLREGEIPKERIHALIRERKLFPMFFGSALKNEGVEALLDFLGVFEAKRETGEKPAFRVYKIARDPQGNRLTFLKMTGGSLKPRDVLVPAEDGLPEEKAGEIRLYSGSRYTTVPRADAGQLCCVTGITRLNPDGEQNLRPCWSCRVIPEKPDQAHALLEALRMIGEEEPLLQTEWIEAKREIRVHTMGDVYLEVLERQLKERFGLNVTFGENSVIYRETILEETEGVGHYEPLRHYAEVHLLLTPLPPGSGIRYASDVSTDDLALNWQRLILTHLQEKVHRGVLTGAPVTDIRFTLVAGKAHLKHTEGGDFRQATYRAVRQGLMKNRSILLEPYLNAVITVPAAFTGRVMNDLSVMGGKPELKEETGDGLRTIRTEIPASALSDYGKQLRILTKGEGSLETAFLGWRPCRNAEEIIAAKAYDPERDLLNSPDSVFCSHGAGVTVSWRETEQYMHLPLRSERKSSENRSESAPAGAAVSAYRGTAEEDEVLRKIFEKTYGPAKVRELISPPKETPAPAETPVPQAVRGDGEILLIDGYNVLFAWEEWKDLLKDHFETARGQLTDLLCDYAAMTGNSVILVFDAYRVKGNPGSAERYRNIYVVYTREAQTADAYIEKCTLTARKQARIRVVTSDRPEQMIALGNEALRTPAREFKQEVIRVQGNIRAFIERNNRPGTERALERLYKEAWRKETENPQKP